eukprot:SAG31_NODE_750_length_12362_cov_6.912827_1_plen_951_part_10
MMSEYLLDLVFVVCFFFFFFKKKKKEGKHPTRRHPPRRPRGAARRAPIQAAPSAPPLPISARRADREPGPRAQGAKLWRGGGRGRRAAMGTARRDALLEIQAQSQKLWEETKPYERDAPADGEGEKFMCTFPYPYMNGRLHVGHAFSLTKTEFAVRYNRLKGRNAIWPFGLHCTGMPIQAAAQRIDEEMKAFGNPPVFPVEEPAAAAGGQKSKVAAKTGGAARQWNIMQGMKLKDGEIPPFKDADHWLDYFPPLCVQDLKKMGCAIDWRRSFITTDRNPYYDAFIRWQFRVLKSQGKVKFGKRNTIYSPKDGQPCADHDRSEGEGVAPKDYCLLKLKVQKLTEKMAPLEGKNVYLCAATLRAETMPGQTNCFVKPDGEYGAYEYNETDVFIVGAHCARNMAYQGGSLEFGVPKNLLTLQGTDLIGLPLGAPRAVHETIYCLPMFNIKMDMGSGVVTSVPSDAPDDWAALRDLKEKPNLREKYGVTEEMVAFDPIPIIDIPGYGDMAAVDLVTKYKIASQNDRDKLAEAKHEVYLKGFEEGMMITGECKDKPVKFAKVKCKETMIEEGLAVPYAEPENTVISRGGDVCVVCMTDQWYLTYGEEEWREKTLKWVEQMECYASETKNQFRSVLGWLNQWACSRTFGLGTRLPWDEEWLIESLSDSTIYMAYYTISKYLQGENNLRGNEVGPSGIKPEQLDDAFFEYVFRKGPYPDNCTIPKAIMDEMRNEFEYWYPMDLRVSGKDLIGNHLTMCLYNHTAIWPDDETKWPRSIYTNGHVLVNNEKMSKSKGTFLTLVDTIEKYSADAMRLALADAGDTNEDGNFSEDTADKAVLKLTTLKEWFEGTEKSVGVFQALDKMRAGPITSFADRVFDSEMNECIMKADENFAKMQFKDALLYCFYQLTNARDFYRQACCGAMDVTKYHKDLVIRFTEVFCICMSPFTPHFCEYIYGKL